MDYTEQRVRRMEILYECLERYVQTFDELLQYRKVMLQCAHELSEYMVTGNWLHDYETDERGEITSDVAKGVLSQDGLYNLLDKWKELDAMLAKTNEEQSIAQQ